MTSHSDEILQFLSLARAEYLKAGALVDEAINRAKSHQATEAIAEKLRQAKHDMAGSLTVIFNSHLTLTDQRAKKKAAKSKPDSHRQQRTIEESKPR